MPTDGAHLKQLSKLIRSLILTSSTVAGSGHPTSSLSAVELMVALMFGGFFRFDVQNQKHPNNDRLIFSKGHASPLFYSLWAVAGGVPLEELSTFRKFGSRLEGHPTMEFPFTEAPTGSLGQGLSIGAGMALNAQYVDKLPYRTFVLLGDSEAAEGSVWEAMEVASYYKLTNLIGVLDVNRLGQRGETMLGHDVSTYEQRARSFGWETCVIDGHDLDQVCRAYERAMTATGKPFMIIAKTLKGKGISFLEDTDGWHGKTLNQEELSRALAELGEVDMSLKGEVAKPEDVFVGSQSPSVSPFSAEMYPPDKRVATRKAYGNALARLVSSDPRVIVLDAEVSNSTYAEFVKKEHAEKFFEMFVAEQNMVGVALGFSRRGKKPFVSTFAAFLTRAFDQIRMCQYANADIVFCGSHAGVSIGEDGASQMALEDLAMFRALLGSVVLYPSDAVSTEKLMDVLVARAGLAYIRTTRKETPILYSANDTFYIGGSKVLRESAADAVTVVGAGVTLHEALKSYDELSKEGISIRVIDLYSIKPVDRETLLKAAKETKAIITVEDHFAQGGLGEAVMSALSDVPVVIHQLAVEKMPRSGKPDELLDYENISSRAISEAVKDILQDHF